jgi:large subunit ribosomal protein L28
MARRCQLTGKQPAAGNNRSFSNRATRRRFIPNIITKRLWDPKKKRFVKMRIAASTLRTLLKQDRKAKKKAEELMG